MSYRDRLTHAIPGGAHTYSRGFDQFPANAPQILARGEGAYIWDPDGRRLLDYGMGLRAVTLGYGYPSVAEAAQREILNGNNLSLPSMTELKAAELVVDLIPAAEMVKFAKNGSNVTTGAAKVARAFTGRRYICVPRQQPFFSFDDWFIGTTAVTRGIPPEHSRLSLMFDYNDIQSLEKLFDEFPGEIAGVMLEPATTLTPCAPGCTEVLEVDRPCQVCPAAGLNFLQNVQRLCRANGALFILDEMITGFRWHLQGAQTYYGVQPDLTTFGKGMSNGFSVAALLGRREVMDVGSISKEGAERTFLMSTTNGAEMCGLGAFIETVRVYREKDVIRHLWVYGQRLLDGMRDLAARHGLEKHFVMEGNAPLMNYSTRDAEGNVSLPLRTLFSQEMIKRGVLMPWPAVSFSHGEAEFAETMTAVDGALKVYADALEGGVERFLEGPAIRPVFRRFN